MKINGNILEAFKEVTEYWSPKIVTEVNDEYIKVAKFKGELIWHEHANEDEMFYVVKGRFYLHVENEVMELSEGDFYVVKKGVQHKPVASEECWVMLIEKKETKHTGDRIIAQTKSLKDQLK